MAKNLSDLKHTTHDLPSGGKIILLDTGATIDAEAEAMLQALHSRSSKGVEDHLRILEKRGAEKFMENFYVGYGHKSIGDCGSTTIFIEGVSMLVAKAIQDWQLYSGQESSTRYIDFAGQAFRDPVGTGASHLILEDWRTFYIDSQKEVQEYLRAQYPRQEDEDETKYTKAIEARTFDILRGFLPAGATTNLAWHTNLRQAADKLMLLRNHPLAEVREVSAGIQTVLAARYPSSFNFKEYPDTEKYYVDTMTSDNYFDGSDDSSFKKDSVSVKTTIDTAVLAQHKTLLQNRPQKTDLPKFLSECGNVQFSFLLDFGSFRDVQRHRAVTQRMPLLSTTYGFEPWYLSELPSPLAEKARELIALQKKRIIELGTNKETAQYYIAMGYRTPNRITGGLPALVYLVELRSTRFVHPTLSRRAQEMGKILLDLYADSGLVLHLDPEPGRFDIGRGAHDIKLKE